MISAEEKRFIRYWQDQRTGGFNSYYLMYSFLGMFIISLFVFVVLFFFIGIYTTKPIIIIVPVLSYIASAGLSIYSWRRNEKRMKEIIRREIRQGELSDEWPINLS